MEDKQRTADQLKSKGNKISANHPQLRANVLSKIFFCWSFPFFIKGLRKDLTENDLYGPLSAHESKRLGDRLENAWNSQIKSSRHPSFWKALIKVFGPEFAKLGFMVLIIEFGIKMSQPIFLGLLMDYYVPNQTTVSKDQAYLYAGMIVAMSFLNVLLGHNYMLANQHLGMKMRVACCSLIYRKALRLSKSALTETTVGQMVNLLSNDVGRFDMALIHAHNLWVSPIETILVLGLLYYYSGFTSMVGVGILVLFIPLQLYIGKRTSVYRLRTAMKTDQRVRLMNEIICGIQVIKMYTWEKPFAKLVEISRNLELHQIRATSYLRAINLSFNIFLNRTSIYLCVLTYVLLGNTLQPQYVYVIISFYGILRQALTMFLPQGVMSISETNVSVKRLRTFLMYDEIETKNKPTAKDEKVAVNGFNDTPPGVHMHNVSVKWSKSAPECSLNNITFDVAPGELVAVIGPVGSGKTTLLHVILKELPLYSGTQSVGGRISYASQEPWLFSGSIRQNILFGQPYEPKKYREVVRVCALQRDFTLFPFGDRTIVGERGTMLSGGQKARINLARAVYKDADIYLLDDPLSAVDTHVGKQLFDHCIAGYLKNKCTVLVTHQLQYLNSVNRLYLLENGEMKAQGTFNELRAMNIEFLKLLENEEEIVEEVAKRQSVIEMRKSRSKSVEELQSDQELPVEVKEHRSSGSISKKVYLDYVKAGGHFCISFLILVTFPLTQICGSGVDMYLTYWVNLEQERQSFPNSTVQPFLTSENCLYIYSALIAFLIVITLTRSLSFFLVCMRASQNLHNKMFSSILQASMRFFNTNPSGRILNRFAKDVGSIDEVLPTALMDTIQIGLIVFAITLVVASVNPWILIPTVVILALFYCYRIVFLATSRDLKRLEGTSRSPVFTHLTASLYGLTTIRAFNAEDLLRQEFDQHQDLHSSAFYMFLGCNRTFGFWLDLNCVIYIGLVTLSFLFIGNETYGGNVGLGITQAITLTGMLQWGMRQWSELENQMTSVERVVEYTDLPPESDSPVKKPDKSWPSQGEIDFQSVSMRYSEDEPFVLTQLSFKVKPGEKIGIVGRTGAGKSSLISALFRLAPIEGKIVIDGLSTKEISLSDLRSKVSIIPQEPVLFSGTLRKNLDPFDDFNDDQLWDALDEVELKAQIADLPSGLHSKVSEGGSNFSVGQRQLLCLARAVVRNNKILVLDEATANVDPQTDELIQATIRRKFGNCTVLTIAHRLNTVMDSDKILVMDSGRAAQFDHPHVLLSEDSGIFYGLVKETGRGMADHLHKIAEEAFKTTETK